MRIFSAIVRATPAFALERERRRLEGASMPTRAAVLCLVMVTATAWLSAAGGKYAMFRNQWTHALQAYGEKKRKTSTCEYDYPFVCVRHLQTARFRGQGPGLTTCADTYRMPDRPVR